MDIVKVIFLILHFIGIASLLGSFIVQMKDIVKGRGKVLPGMFHGALTMLVTGLVLVLIAEFTASPDDPVNHMKVGIKLLILIAVLVLVLIYRKRENPPAWALWAIGLLTTANIVVAVSV